MNTIRSTPSTGTPAYYLGRSAADLAGSAATRTSGTADGYRPWDSTLRYFVEGGARGTSMSPCLREQTR